jgi:hypothetical protein
MSLKSHGTLKLRNIPVKAMYSVKRAQLVFEAQWLNNGRFLLE